MMVQTLPRKDLLAGSSSLSGLCSSDGWFRRVRLGFRATGGGSGLFPPAASLLMLLECESKLRAESVRVWTRTCHRRGLLVMFWFNLYLGLCGGGLFPQPCYSKFKKYLFRPLSCCTLKVSPEIQTDNRTTRFTSTWTNGNHFCTLILFFPYVFSFICLNVCLN